MSYQAILFDFDGVVVDSEPVHYACWLQVLDPLGIDFSWDHYHSHFIGLSDFRMLEHLAEMAPPSVTLQDVQRVYPQKIELFRAEMQRLLPFSPGVPDLMRRLSAQYRIAVVTSSRRREVEPVLEAGALRDLLGVAVYAEDVTRHKPDPEPYLHAASLLGISRALVVEDSAAGEAAGRAAGFDVLRVGQPSQVAAAVLRHLECVSMKA